MGRILIHSDANRHANWFQNLSAYLSSLGHDVVWVRPNYVPWSLDLAHVFFCHGNHSTQVELREICDRLGVPWTIAEIGFFPQRGHYFLDRRGINARSALMDDDLSWIGDRHLGRLREFAEEYVGAYRWTRKNKYVFAPLQLEIDSNIALHSPYKTMQAFIDHVERMFPGEPVVFKAHPLDPHGNYRVAPGNTLLREGHLFELARDARLVYGINSTVLYETLMQGIPTQCVGDGLLMKHKGNEERLLAALVDQQIPVAERDLGYWLERYANPFRTSPLRVNHLVPLTRFRMARRMRRTAEKARRIASR